MRAVIQRVNSAELFADGKFFSSIKKGLCVTVGICKDDDIAIMEKMARKIATIRIFNRNDKLNESVKDIDGEVLLISNFTLCSTKNSGARPDFSLSADKVKANDLYNRLIVELQDKHQIKIKTGKFGAEMKIKTELDGPITIYWEI